MTEQSQWAAKWDRLLNDSRRRVAPEDSPFPTPAQLDLLHAALMPAVQAAPAWKRWKARGFELQTVQDAPSTRLFPLLWANREAAGIGAEDLPLLKGTYRSTFAANASRIHAALEASRILAEAGVPVLFIKGAALIAINAERTGLRAIDDVDLLVPEADALRAITALTTAGYVDGKPDSRPVGYSHARGYRAPSGAPIDLHWRAHKTAGDDSGFFDTAWEAELLGQPVRVPSATDCLMLTLTNAFQVFNSPRLRWIADASLLLNGGGIDWDLLIKRARRPGVALRLRSGLKFMADEFQSPVPARVLEELEQLPVSWQERGAFWAATHQPVVGSQILGELESHQARRMHSRSDLPRGFVWHLAQASGTGERRRDVLRRAPRTAVRSAALLVLSYRTRPNVRKHTD